jgi:hypothetical protein
VRCRTRGGELDLETALLAACLRLLRSLHRRGWVHGDAHLGNFVLAFAAAAGGAGGGGGGGRGGGWRVYAIDAERSFRSGDAGQQLLDAQEAFGHASGLLLALAAPADWDMRDVPAVAREMHPARVARRHRRKCANLLAAGPAAADPSPPPPESPLCNLLPVCDCFVHQDRRRRLAGCALCRARGNRRQARLYREGALEAWLRALTPAAMLPAVRGKVRRRRVALGRRRRHGPPVRAVRRRRRRGGGEAARGGGGGGWG